MKIFQPNINVLFCYYWLIIIQYPTLFVDKKLWPFRLHQLYHDICFRHSSFVSTIHDFYYFYREVNLHFQTHFCFFNDYQNPEDRWLRRALYRVLGAVRSTSYQICQFVLFQNNSMVQNYFQCYNYLFLEHMVANCPKVLITTIIDFIQLIFELVR